MEYTSVSFTISSTPSLLQPARELLADSAASVGFDAFEDTDDGICGYVLKESFDKEALDSVIADFPLDGVSISYVAADAADEDWNKTWEDNGFEPIIVDNKVIVYDSCHTSEDDLKKLHEQYSDGIFTAIEAKLAFGTGTHETTRMVISSLLAADVAGKDVLDCGCGTGILSIVAGKLGAASVAGYDIDEWSVNNAKHNAELNGISCMQVYYGDAKVLNHISGMFDIVVANINRNILLNDMPSFREVMKMGSRLILSGFYTADIPVIEEKARSLGFHKTLTRTDNDWACVTFILDNQQ